jgi:hypothetical protein
MKLFSISSDGGKNSGVTGLWIIEIKYLFSIAILFFSKGSRENYHSHAFNAYSWFISGKVEEQHINEEPKIWTPSIIPKWTPRNTFHRVNALEKTICFTIRGPWSDTWYEYDPENKNYIEMTHGRKILSTSKKFPN